MNQFQVTRFSVRRQDYNHTPTHTQPHESELHTWPCPTWFRRVQDWDGTLCQRTFVWPRSLPVNWSDRSLRWQRERWLRKRCTGKVHCDGQRSGKRSWKRFSFDGFGVDVICLLWGRRRGVQLLLQPVFGRRCTTGFSLFWFCLIKVAERRGWKYERRW